MKTLVLGASGATGKELVNQLLVFQQQVKIIVRPNSNFPNEWSSNDNVKIIRGNINAFTIDEMAQVIADCGAVVSCLGHNLSFRGMFGKPRKLVTDAVKLVTGAIESCTTQLPIRFVLMNTAGNQNRCINEKISVAEKLAVSAIRVLLPPHSDNEMAAIYLQEKIGIDHSSVEWVVIRPDSLINNDEVTAYCLHISPVTSAIFKPGKTSRINVGNCMARLILDDELWEKWKGEMPVIYNENSIAQKKLRRQRLSE